MALDSAHIFRGKRRKTEIQFQTERNIVYNVEPSLPFKLIFPTELFVPGIIYKRISLWNGVIYHKGLKNANCLPYPSYSISESGEDLMSTIVRI